MPRLHCLALPFRPYIFSCTPLIFLSWLCVFFCYLYKFLNIFRYIISLPFYILTSNLFFFFRTPFLYLRLLSFLLLDYPFPRDCLPPSYSSCSPSPPALSSPPNLFLSIPFLPPPLVQPMSLSFPSRVCWSAGTAASGERASCLLVSLGVLESGLFFIYIFFSTGEVMILKFKYSMYNLKNIRDFIIYRVTQYEEY